MKPKAKRVRSGGLPLEVMTIKRDGTLYISPVEGSGHCGATSAIINGVLAVDYSVVAKCKPVTDARGFLFDQLEVDTWLRNWVSDNLVSISCEELAKTLAEMLITKIRYYSPTCRILELQLTLSPAPHLASITVQYGSVS